MFFTIHPLLYTYPLKCSIHSIHLSANEACFIFCFLLLLCQQNCSSSMLSNGKTKKQNCLYNFVWVVWEWISVCLWVEKKNVWLFLSFHHLMFCLFLSLLHNNLHFLFCLLIFVVVVCKCCICWSNQRHNDKNLFSVRKKRAKLMIFISFSAILLVWCCYLLHKQNTPKWANGMDM